MKKQQLQGKWLDYGHTAVAVHGAATPGSLWQRSLSRPNKHALMPGEGSRWTLRSLSEVNIHFTVVASGMAKEKFCSATFFSGSPKQPSQILCETRRGTNMKISENSDPKHSRCHHYLLLSPAFWTSARGKQKDRKWTRIANSHVPRHRKHWTLTQDSQYCTSTWHVVSIINEWI